MAPDPRSPPPPADLLLTGGRVLPLGDAGPAGALLVRGGRVAALGSPDEMAALASPGTRVIDVAGGTVTPGFTDAHVHWTAWALSRRRLDLTGTRTPQEAAERVRVAAAGGDGWLLGGGWSVHEWGAFPAAELLDSVAPHRPVLLESRDLHAAWLNSEALRRCGIGPDTPDPPGGEIRRAPGGAPSGVVLEVAREAALAALPAPSMPEIVDALDETQGAAHRLGLTGLHSVEPDGLDHVGRLREEGRLRLRILQHIPLARLEAAAELGVRSGFGDGWLRIGGVKVFLDGTLGSYTAWLRAPYEGGGGDHGIRILEPEVFHDAVGRAARAGLAMTVHAIGDGAVALALSGLGAHPAPAAVPHRIEHLQLCPPDLLDLVARCGVVASVQPAQIPPDAHPAELHWGPERARWAYPFASLAERGVTLAFGSDAPVADVDPRAGLHAARTRLAAGAASAGSWHPEEQVDGETALRAFTEGPALAAGLLHRRGRLLPGYDADLVVWDGDPVAVPPEELPGLRCLLTVVGGELVHDAISS